MSSGKKSTFYDINVKNKLAIDVDYICEAYGFTFAEGNAFKALVGIAKSREIGETRHKGTDAKRDANKLVHYAQLVQTPMVDAEIYKVELNEI